MGGKLWMKNPWQWRFQGSNLKRGINWGKRLEKFTRHAISIEFKAFLQNPKSAAVALCSRFKESEESMEKRFWKSMISFPLGEGESSWLRPSWRRRIILITAFLARDFGRSSLQHRDYMGWRDLVWTKLSLSIQK